MKASFAGYARAEDFTPEGLRTYQQQLQTMEDWGFDHLGLADSQSIWREMYVTMTLMALYTRKAKLWTTVTNPLTRHPAVAASAHASIDELSGGRVIFNIGSGDSAVYNLGLKGASVSFFRDYVTAVRELFAKHETVYQGKTIRLTWPQRRIPVYITAEGPKMLQMAGEIADGVLVGVGLQPEVVKDALNHIEAGAKRAGRSLQDIDIWWFIKCNLDDDKQAAIDEVKMTLTASANHAFRFTLEGKFIPDEYKDRIRKLQAQYVFAEHEAMGAERRNAQLVDEFGLTDYLAERFTVCGPPSEFVAKLGTLRDAGVNKYCMAMIGSNSFDKFRRLAQEVMPHFS